MRGMQREMTRRETQGREDYVKMKAEIGVKTVKNHTMSKNLGQPPEARRSKSGFSPENLPREQAWPCHALISGPGIQNSKRINFCCFRPRGLQFFVPAVSRN